jgi:predicted amidohydrolase
LRVAAYQAPLLPAGSCEAIDLIRAQIVACERERVDVLCCPEGILGGLADYAPDPWSIAIDSDRLGSVIEPLRSETVTTILGFTELAGGGTLFNAAAILHRGTVAGIYRKVHPAIRRSLYAAGTEAPVFTLHGVTFGIVICYDSQFPDLIDVMSGKGATMLFIPTNNGLPRARDRSGLVAEARAHDVAHATRNHLWVIRADVIGDNGTLACDGASGIVDPNGRLVAGLTLAGRDLLVAEVL